MIRAGQSINAKPLEVRKLQELAIGAERVAEGNKQTLRLGPVPAQRPHRRRTTSLWQTPVCAVCRAHLVGAMCAASEEPAISAGPDAIKCLMR